MEANIKIKSKDRIGFMDALYDLINVLKAEGLPASEIHYSQDETSYKKDKANHSITLN